MIGMMAWPMGLLLMEEVVIEIIIGLMVAPEVYTGNDDLRGYVNLWGSVVQFRRGYMKRNYPGPYNVSPGVGYDKNYNYDWNLKLRPPPYFPDLQNTNNTVILKMASYGEANRLNDEE